MKRHLALVGFMASGKSTIGKRLAGRLGCAFFDTDELVEREHGAVSGVFLDEGEPAFRRYESVALQRVLEGAIPAVIALGGGALTVDENLKALEKRSYRVFVRVSPEYVLERLRRSRRIRPLLGPAPTLARIRELYARRMPQYARADVTIEADRLDTSQVVDGIIEWLHKKKISI